MKHQTTTNLLIRSSLALALITWFPIQAQPATPAAPAAEQKTMGGKMMEDKVMKSCQAMKEQKQQLMEASKAQDAALTEQLTKMNSAPEDKKMDLMASVITLMAEHRIAMNGRKAKMEEAMMSHMMQHMQGSTGSKSPSCPMMNMKDMKDMDMKPEAAHSEHDAGKD